MLLYQEFQHHLDNPASGPQTQPPAIIVPSTPRTCATVITPVMQTPIVQAVEQRTSISDAVCMTIQSPAQPTATTSCFASSYTSLNDKKVVVSNILLQVGRPDQLPIANHNAGGFPLLHRNTYMEPILIKSDINYPVKRNDPVASAIIISPAATVVSSPLVRMCIKLLYAIY